MANSSDDFRAGFEDEFFHIVDGTTFGYEYTDASKTFAFVYFSETEGVISVKQTIALPKNALVRRYDATVTAKRADRTLLQNVAQTRAYSEGGENWLVIDFGVPRTVSGLIIPKGQITKIKPWIGSRFDDFNIAQIDQASDVLFKSELRSERLRVDISQSLSAQEIANETFVRLPESPAGLQLRINGTLAWEHVAPAQPTGESAVTDDRWNKDSQRLIHLADALAALTGDTLADESMVSFQVELTSTVPGLLQLAFEPQPDFGRIRRIKFGGNTATDLALAAEGATELPLELPAPAAGQSRTIEEVRFTAVGNFAAERTLPPLGPAAASGADPAAVPVLADLIVDTDRAACVRLSASPRLAALVGVRLPLSAVDGGAEARVVLWSNQDGRPGEPLPNATSDPVIFDAASSAAEVWTTFSFPKPVPISEAPWAALIVTRGVLTWAVAAKPVSAADPLQDNELLRGPGNGPWRALPATLLDGPGALIGARGRIRMIGHAPKDAPIAPLDVALSAMTDTVVAVTPNVKGIAAALTLQPAVTAAQPALHIVHRLAGTVTLRDVDVISNL